MKILLTGFEPFNGMPTNASWEAVKLVNERFADGIALEKLLLPVEYGKAADLCIEAIGRQDFDAVLSVGVASGRRVLTPEYLAINVKDARIPDNAGVLMRNESIIDEGESVLYTNLPYAETVAAILSTGLSAEASFDAGTFVCNDLFYRVLHHIHDTEKTAYCGFLHVPPESVVPSERVARAIEAILLMLKEKKLGK